MRVDKRIGVLFLPIAVFFLYRLGVLFLPSTVLFLPTNKVLNRYLLIGTNRVHR
jgi:hypothetical protein